MEALGRKSTAANLSNVVKIKVIPASDVNRVKRMENRTRHLLPEKSVRVKDGKVFYDFRTIPPLCNFSENKIDGDAGLMYSGVVKMFLPDDSAEIAYILENLHQEKFLVAFQESAGTFRLLGDNENPCILEEDFTTAGNRGRSFTFKCTATHRAYFVPSINSWNLYGNTTESVGVVIPDVPDGDGMPIVLP